MNPVQQIENIGRLAIIVGRMVATTRFIFRSLGLIVRQMYSMGFKSIWLIAITSIFTGGVSAWQAAYQFKDYVPMRYLGGAVGKAVMMEFGPVLTALVVAGRVGAGIAAELGSMRVTEQIDAMESMSVDPVRYLVMPRFISGIIMLPVLVAVADFVAMLGALVVATQFVGLNFETFMNGFRQFLRLSDFFIGLSKAAVFGAIISVMGCYHGFNTRGGATGVGVSTTQAVVASAVLILIANFGMAVLLFRL